MKFNFNTYYNYISYNKYDINYLFKELLNILEYEIYFLNKKLKDINKNYVYEYLKHYDYIFNLEIKKKDYLKINVLSFNQYKKNVIYKNYINIQDIIINEKDNDLKEKYIINLIENYFNCKVLIEYTNNKNENYISNNVLEILKI